MAVQENVLLRGIGLTYPSTKPIASKTHMEVQVHEPIADAWTIVSVEEYDLITNSCVFNVDYDLSAYDLINVRVGDTPNDLATQPSDIGTVSGIADEVVIVSGIADEVVTVANIETEVVATAGMETQIRDITTEPLRQSILDAEGNATSAAQSASDAEDTYQATLLVEPEVVAQGATQEQRVIDEGDTQAARLAADVDEAEDSAGEALASELSSDSWANAPRDTDVIDYTWNPITNLIEQVAIPNARSSFHWQEIAKLASGGLTYTGIWDVVDCSEPPTPTPAVGEVANGFFYIVGTVSGDSTGCPNVGVGDWLVWSGDLAGDGTVEGAWGLVNWSFAWNAISDVTVNGSPTANGQDLLPTTGGTMSGNINLDNNINLMVKEVGGTARNAVRMSATDRILVGDANTTLALSGSSASFEGVLPTTDQPQGSGANELTRKDYVDTKLAITGGTMSGDLTVGDGTTGNSIWLRETPSGGGEVAFSDVANERRARMYYDSSANLFNMQFWDASGVIGETITFDISGNISVNGVAPTSGNHLTRKDYVDGVNATQDTAIALNTAKVGVVTRTLTDQTSTRAKDVTYTNDTGHEIEVVIGVTSASTQTMTFTANGLESTFGGASGDSNSRRITHTQSIPTGGTYILEGAGTLVSWLELR